ncbi:MAG: phosphate ABC transporter substrate-binding protein, partial [Anaerolineales bacterium]
MSSRQFFASAGVALMAASILLAACGPAAVEGTILVDGSSTVAPITSAVAEEFQQENPDVRVPVGISGTGGGFN